MLGSKLSLDGSGLFRKSLRAVSEDEEVDRDGCAGSFVDGEGETSFGSPLFFDFEDLVESFERESCSC